MQIYTTPLMIAVLVFVVGIHLPHTHAQDVQDIDECAANPYICGYAYNPTYGQYGPTGACVNTNGSYYCVCYPPFVATYLYRSCYYSQTPQQNFYQNAYSLYLFDELFDIDFM